MTKPKVVFRTIVLPRHEAKWFAGAALSATSTDDITPVICAAQMTATPTSLRFVATDRYRVHTATIQLAAKTVEHEFLMPRAALLWLDKNVSYFGRWGSELQIATIATTDDGELTVSVRASTEPDASYISWHGRCVPGNFPPVHRLIEIARAAEVGPPIRLNVNFIAKTRPLTRSLSESPRIKFTASDKPNRPGPAYFTFGGDTEPYAEALIQPNLEIRAS